MAIPQAIAKHEPALSARGLRKTYHVGKVDIHALRDVDVDLYDGELIVLLGPSGSGKSTLLNILGGLDTPSEGRVLFRGNELDCRNQRALTRYRREHVGFVFQFYNLVASLTAQENVALVTELAAAPMSPSQALTLVGLGDRLNAFPAELSGGEQQRVAIARAVAKQPQILLCDEPTGALDSQTGVLVLRAIDKVNRELGTATAVITHNTSIAQMADRVLFFADGRIVDVKTNTARKRPEELSW